MATSPFKIFRKYNKILLSVTGVLAILVFTVGDSLMKVGQDKTAEENLVVAKWSEGEISERDLQQWVGSRMRLAGILEEFAQQALIKQAQPTRQPIVVSRAINERSTVYTMLLNKKAQQLGITVSDDYIKDYINGVTANVVSREDIETTVGQRGWTVDSLYDTIRHEFLALQVQQVFQGAMSGTTPATELDYYLRVNRRVAADIVAFPVADFISQVAEPSEKELKEYFERFKLEEPQVDFFGRTELQSPLPAFKQPQKAAVEFFFADFNEFVKKAVVTEEAMREHYEQFKDRDYREAELPAVDENSPPEEEQGDGETDSTEPGSTETDNTEPDSGDAEGTEPDEGKSTEDEPSTDQSPKDNEPAAPAPTTDDPQPETPKATESNDSNTPDTAATESAEGSQAPDASEDKAAEDKETPPPTDGTKTNPPGDETPAPKPTGETTEEQPPAGDPKPENPVTDPPAEGETPTDGTEGTAPAGETPAGEPAAGEPGAEQPPKEEVKYKPFEEVKEEVREQLARTQARQDIDTVFAELRSRLEDYNIRRVSVTPDTPKSQLPQRPNFAAVAKSKGLTSGSTKLLSADQFETETEIGKSFEMMITRQGIFQQPYTQLLFRQTGETSLFRPIPSEDSSFNKYLSWKTEEVESRVPELDEVRDQIVRAWKIGAGVEDDTKHARGLARQAANNMLQQASAPSASLLELGRKAGRQEVETNLFSWIEAPLDMRSQPQVSLSNVTGVDEPGPAFFNVATGLAVGEIGVAMDHPQTFAYTIKVIEEERPLSELVENFLNRRGSQTMAQATQQAMSFDWQQVGMTWLKDMEKEYDLEWEVEPDQEQR